jgi:hypothetical protein
MIRSITSIILTILCFNVTAQTQVLGLNFNGNTNDATGLHTTILSGGPAVFVPGSDGSPNGAMRFDGINDFITVPHASDLDLTNGFTIQVLIRPRGFYQGTCHVNMVLTKGSTTDPGQYSLFYTDDVYVRSTSLPAGSCNFQTVEETKQCFIGGRNQNPVIASSPDQNTPPHSNTIAGSVSIYSTYTNQVAPIDTNQWYCVHYTYDDIANISRLFINGKLCATNSTAIQFDASNTKDMWIGRLNDIFYPSFTYWITADVDDIKIFNYPFLPNTNTSSETIQCFLPLSTTEYDRTNYTLTISQIANRINFATNGNQNTTLQIFDVSGKIVQQLSLVNSLELPTTNLAKGIYMARVVSNKGGVGPTSKFVVE